MSSQSRDTGAFRLPDRDIPSVIATAHALAEAARRETLRHFRAEGLETRDKSLLGAGRFDPVTEADRAAEAAMRAILAERRPADGILGEEAEDVPGTSGLTWVLDPIDGTRGFITGTPTWGVLIALCDAVGPLYGIIDQPYIGERFEGGLGRARLTGPRGGRGLGARPAAALDAATLFSTFPEVGSAAERAGFEAVRDAVKLTRYGMDCYAYALIAAGQVDLVIEAGLHPYDICAPIAVIEAAGGIVTDWQGGPAHGGGRVLAASGPAVHAEALEILRQVPQ
ncbi:inositol monophosphatase family protein [Roseibacterium sp. SDUM158016]|uniref:inositol monophosphatase family protein n=1 Tax=Roseicyclus sediminis TaxID=2980997 RepID=UPI0021D14F02|nr:inositol monophosphatase family protein [Roseibacterium sp. SDUM158016]MCU4652603.1 inositol monophosphatase family protein [Roseibacterium sp. SDUM158016]